MAGPNNKGKKLRRCLTKKEKRRRQRERTARNTRKRRVKFEAWCRDKIAALREAGKEEQAGRVQGHLQRHHNRTQSMRCCLSTVAEEYLPDDEEGKAQDVQEGATSQCRHLQARVHSAQTDR